MFQTCFNIALVNIMIVSMIPGRFMSFSCVLPLCLFSFCYQSVSVKFHVYLLDFSESCFPFCEKLLCVSLPKQLPSWFVSFLLTNLAKLCPKKFKVLKNLNFLMRFLGTLFKKLIAKVVAIKPPCWTYSGVVFMDRQENCSHDLFGT